MIPLNKKALAFLALATGSYYTLSNYHVEGLQNIRLTPRPATTASTTNNTVPYPGSPSGFPSTLPQPATSEGGMSLTDRLALWSQGVTTQRPTYTATSATAKTIRVGSFNLQMFGASKVAKPQVMEALAKIGRQYDVLALQEISGQEQDLLPTLVEKINQSGRAFDYLIGPRVGGEGKSLQFAFLFDTHRIETDRIQLYTVEDPSQLLTYDPLVAWFRTKELAIEDAFTFTMVNVLIDEGRKEDELRLLPELMMSIRRDGRQEDDCILVGDFGVGDGMLQHMRSAGIAPALHGLPTNVRGNSMFDNICFSQTATSEFNGRVGVTDFLRDFNLSLDQALEISDHLPIWVEFYIHEGGQIGRIAPTQGPGTVY